MVRHGSPSARRTLHDGATPARSMALAEAAARGAPKARIPRWLARHEQLGQAGLARKRRADAGEAGRRHRRLTGPYVMGLRFLRRRKSALIDGAGASDLAAHLAAYLHGRITDAVA